MSELIRGGYNSPVPSRREANRALASYHRESFDIETQTALFRARQAAVTDVAVNIIQDKKFVATVAKTLMTDDLEAKLILQTVVDYGIMMDRSMNQFGRKMLG